MSKTNKEKLPDLNRVPFKTRVRPYLIVAPSLIITIGIMVPFVMAIWYSLTNFSFKLPAHKFIGLTNWVNVLSSGSTWKAIWVTLLYGVASTAVEMALGMGVAMLLNSLNNRFSKIMRVVLIFPLMVASVTATIVWQLMLNSSAGIVEKLLNVFNVYNFPWASSPKTAMMTVVLIDVWVNTAFVILLVLAGLQSLPKSPFESAKIDGGSNWFNFRNLTLPMLRPSLYIALLFRLMAALQEYAVIYALTKGGPGDALMSLSLTAYQQGFKFQKFGAALPYILILWLIINVVAKEIVKRQRAAQKQAAGLDE